MNCKTVTNNPVINSNPSARLINALSIELFDKGYSNYQNRPRRKVFNIEVAQAIRQNPAQTIKNRIGTSVKKIKTGDIA
ncbi:MAG: hypothetical protein ACD_47C00335G0003 [uncultured bacterium]|uniref:Uncharacterized protein n=1 Tax=Candidatus Wallbacteria bacterium GWC2_49_35 TaxID=1817813 RepID=A0A1F7WW77_9BACT|nr:MAG: hypothetical protein ACD_47C00335G0003 [uncultured bacterium]OGM07046.1 MAG: hypothetical protein A2008_13230 [Candidatus Wallbacteria bacterium GWC2_49_35]HBC75441.1 hypothetical protein [Candidatus Wallbacteria bacterium]